MLMVLVFAAPGLASAQNGVPSASDLTAPEMMVETMESTMKDKNIELSIRFFDKTIYFPDSDIFIRMTVGNNSGSTYRFKLADNRLFNLEFDVRSPLQTPLGPSDRFITTRAGSRQVFYREVAIEPGEEFSFVENLRDYVAISQPGVYVVSAHFFPELIVGTRAAGVSPDGQTLTTAERLTLAVRTGSADAVDTIALRAEEAIGVVLQRQELSPDEVVAATLDARRRGQWERFFLYIDLQSIMLADPARERRFQRISETEQLRELESFRRLLMEETLEEAIVTVPDEYRIVETSYTAELGRVVAELRFDVGQFIEVKRYTYLLRRRDRFWEIYDYSVVNVQVL